MIADLAAQRALDRLAERGIEAIDETDRTVAAAWTFVAAVANDGFEKYYAGRRGDLARWAPAALRAIGAAELGAIAEEANALFGPAGPARDREARRAQLRAIVGTARPEFVRLEDRFFASDEEIDPLLEAYLARRAR